jgi:DNA polymerase III epsilon subunit-like protein
MDKAEWILLDTETTGFAPPIYVVEVAAQRMQGWEPVGTSFRRLINHGTDIPPEAARVHGYTKEILERDGDAPLDVYAAFAAYVGKRPLVAYNLPYDLDKVLVPEWQRLNIAAIGQHGFCALAFAQRLLDPVPAGNCKLQTLRQFYRLPERGAHTAMGDVDTVVDLFKSVLVPLAKQRGINSWADVVAFCEQEWFASKIAFGKHKGRNFREAKQDSDFHSWIEWLSSSSNERSAAMGRFYLRELEQAKTTNPKAATFSAFAAADSYTARSTSSTTELVLYADPDVAELAALIEHARNRLAELSAEYMSEKRAVDATSAALFERLKEEYRLRDQLHVTVIFRRRFIDTLIEQGEEDAERLTDEFSAEQQQAEAEYQEAVRSAAKSKVLTEDEQSEVKTIWKKLARIFHPDHAAFDADTRAVHEKLFSVINHARDVGDIKLLREISVDPSAYMRRQGWDTPLQSDQGDLENLKELYNSVSLQVIEQIDQLGALRTSNAYQVFDFCRKHAEGFENLVVQHRQMLLTEIEKLDADAKRLVDQIAELLGRPSPI